MTSKARQRHRWHYKLGSLSGYPDSVGRRSGPWAYGHEAWEHLVAWHAGGRRGSAGSVGDAALAAMADIATLRRLLDQAETAAVRTARRHRKSWAEIASQLGIARQSAWERWRELDENMPSATGTTNRPVEEPHGVVDDVAAELVGKLMSPDARAQRRRARITVPNVVGMSWDDARDALLRAGLEAVGADPDGPSLAAAGWPNVVVVDQVPEPGAKLAAGSVVRLWLEQGGGSAGVREPRRPTPTPKSGRAWRDEPSDEAVG
jgi:hypothetical protein